jgi:hypothetical protein
MRRHFLEPVGKASVPDVVRRICGVQTQVASSAELAVRVRRESSRPGEVARALHDGRLIKTWAMRGTLHLLTPEDGGAMLSLLAAGRSWERPGWARYFGVTPKQFAKQIEDLRRVVREALAGKVLTREELIAEVVAHRRLRHFGDELRSGWGSLLKPLAWQGDLCFGPSQGNRVTFQLPEDASPRWAGVPDPAEAAQIVIVAYFGAYGPATTQNFRSFLSQGRVSVKQVRAWIDALGDRLVEVSVEGERLRVLAEHVDELVASTPTAAVRFVPGFDQYVMGPGTDDPHVLPPRRRTAVSRQSGWIAPAVVAGGSVKGTWGLSGDEVRVAWFKEAGKPPRSQISAEVERLASILDRELRAEVSLA